MFRITKIATRPQCRRAWSTSLRVRKVVKWDDAVAKGTSEFPKQLAWDAPAPVKQDADGNYPIPLPGVYKAY